MPITSSSGLPGTASLMEILPSTSVLLYADAPQFTVAAVTDNYLKLTGKQRDTLIGKPIFESFPSTRDEHASSVQQMIIHSFNETIRLKAQQPNVSMRYDIEDANGIIQPRYWQARTVPLLGNDGEVEFLFHTPSEVFPEDIARENAELARSSAYFQGIINTLREPLQVLKPVFEDGKIIDFTFSVTNGSYSAYANTTPEAIKGKRVSEVFPGYLKTSSFTNVARTFETGITDKWEINYDQDGLNLFNEMSAVKYGDEVIVFFTDFTNLKKLQLELIDKIHELERSNQNLEEFAHAASHDLKEPIRKVKFFIDRLKEQLIKNLTPDQLHTFTRIETASNRMESLVDDLLMYSEVSDIPLSKEQVDLNHKLQQVMEDLELDIQQKQALIRIEELPVVRGFGRQLQQLFQNLLSNSLKYSKHDTPPRIAVTASVEKKNDQLYDVIRIEDNGIGFEQVYADQIFGMFARLHGKGQYHGTGIGLSIAKKVTENHHGMIRAEGESGKGATFYVYLQKG